MKKITPFIWYDSEAEDAVNFYVSLFENSAINITSKYNEAAASVSKKEAGSVMTLSFNLAGTDFVAMNGGPAFKKNPSISLMVTSNDEKKIEEIWKKFSDGGKVLIELDKQDYSKKYGWIEDRFGLSWQLMHVENENETKIFPALLFVNEAFGKAKNAVEFYTSVFENSEKLNLYEKDDSSSLLYGEFIIEGLKFAAMDGPGEHNFKFNESFSFVVNCETQKEIDYFWNKLTSEGGQESVCGWLKDKFGISWQITPSNIWKYLSDPAKGSQVMGEVLKMKKIIIADLEKAK